MRRIQLGERQRLWWPELAGNELAAAAGATGGCGVGAAACKRAGCHASSALWNVASATGARTGPKGHRDFAGDERGRRRVSVVGKAATRACKRENGKGEKEEELTGSWPVQTTGPGKRRWWRIDGEDPRRPARGKTSGAAFRGSSGRVRRRGGRGRTGGARGRVREASGWLRPRERWSAATGSVRSREGEGAEGDRDGGKERGE